MHPLPFHDTFTAQGISQAISWTARVHRFSTLGGNGPIQDKTLEKEVGSGCCFP